MTFLNYHTHKKLADYQNRLNKFYYDSPQLRDCNCYSPSIDIAEDEKKIFLELEIPGINKNDLKITLENNILTLQGEKKKIEESENYKLLHRERKYGSFKRSFKLSEEVSSEGIEAEYTNGVLRITLTKSEPQQPAARDISVK